MILVSYLTKNLIKSVLITTFVLLSIILTNLVVRILTDIYEDGIYSGFILPLIVFELLDKLPLLLPLCLLIGIILGFNRLHKNSELIAMQAAGLGMKQFIYAVLIITLPLCLFVAILVLYISPLSEQITFQYRNQINMSNQLDSLMAKTFTLSNDKKSVIYVDQFDNDNSNNQIENYWPMKGIFIYRLDNSNKNNKKIIVAEQARQINNQSGHYLILNNGRIYTFENELLIDILRYQSFNLALNTKAKITQTQQSLKAKTNLQLLLSKDKYYLAEFYWRVSIPIALIMAGILALVVCHFEPRKYQINGLFLGLLVYVIYYHLLSMSKIWAISSNFSVILWFALIHLVLILVMFIYLAYRKLSFLKLLRH